MTNEELAELERMLAKATPGEWIVVRYGDGDSLVICEDEAGDRRVAFMATPGCRDNVERKRVWQKIKANAALIVALRNAAPSLIATAREADALRAENERLRGLAKANNDLARMEVAYRKQLAFERAELANALEAITSQYGDRLPAQFLADLTAMLMRPALRSGAALEQGEG